jgi:hypothetical protein
MLKVSYEIRPVYACIQIHHALYMIRVHATDMCIIRLQYRNPCDASMRLDKVKACKFIDDNDEDFVIHCDEDVKGGEVTNIRIEPRGDNVVNMACIVLLHSYVKTCRWFFHFHLLLYNRRTTG